MVADNIIRCETISTIHFAANLRTLKQLNDQGVSVSPRDQSPPVESRFEAPGEPYLSPRQGASSQLKASPMMQAAGTRVLPLLFEMWM